MLRPEAVPAIAGTALDDRAVLHIVPRDKKRAIGADKGIGGDDGFWPRGDIAGDRRGREGDTMIGRMAHQQVVAARRTAGGVVPGNINRTLMWAASIVVHRNHRLIIELRFT